jgi:hypothetical protein
LYRFDFEVNANRSHVIAAELSLTVPRNQVALADTRVSQKNEFDEPIVLIGVLRFDIAHFNLKCRKRSTHTS